MQNIEKRKKQYLKNFLYNRVEFVPSILPLYGLIVLFNIVFSSIVTLEYIMSTNHDYINTGTEAIFYIQIGLLSIFFIITAASVFSVLFKHVWMYYLMFLESLTIFFVRSVGICFGNPTASFYEGKITLKIGQATIFAIFCLIIVIFRNNAYYPFQNVNHLFSMRQKNTSLYLLGFRLCLGLIVYHDIFVTKTQQLRALLVITFIMFWRSRDSGYLHQFSRKMWDIYYYFISWTCFTFFVANFINLINDKPNMKISDQTLTFKDSVLYFWVYTFPFVITLPLLKSPTVKENFWKNIFEFEDHQLEKVYRKQQIYILCDQLHKIVENLKKSQLKYKDPEFKKLWTIIKKHNSKCTFPGCPLQQLEEHKDESNDDFHEHRKFLKTLKNCLQFSRISLEKLKQKHPDELEIQIEIAHFYLIALKNKQKGMLLYNSYNSKKVKRKDPSKQSQYTQSSKTNQEEIKGNKRGKNPTQEVTKAQNQYSFSERYAIYFLKKQIDNIFIGEQKQANTNVDNELSEFRQKIEVSVTMLAQFWSLLADPKCNLKKMYDLTNFLFPLKLSLQQDWERIKQLKNIQIYSVYAKYLIRMFNDKQNGLKILDEANKIDHELKNKDEIELDDKGGELVEESGIIFMQYDGKNSGVMFQINVNAEKIFGYNKGQLLNKKVNDIMPKVYANQHDRVLQNYQQTNYSTMMNKERHVWGRSKQGFLVPFTILIKPILSFYSQASSSEVYANIKRENYLKEIVGIIIDKNQMVQEYSTSALRLFPNLIQKYESKSKGPGHKFKKEQERRTLSILNICEVIPNFRQIKEKVLTENEEYDLKIERIIKTSKAGEDNFIEKCVYNVSISEINIKTCGKIGSLIKLVKLGNSEYKPIQKQMLQPAPQNSVNGNSQNCPKMDLLQVGSRQQKQNCSNLISIFGLGSVEKREKQSKVKFQVPNTEQILQTGRKFIFSYDMAGNQRSFATAKQIEAARNEKTLNRGKPQKRVSEEKAKSNLAESERRQAQQMKYVGGYTRSETIIKKMKDETLSGFKAQLKVSEQKNEEAKVDYGKGIKPKRLTDNVIKELREQEADLQFNNGVGEGEKEEQSQEIFSEIKPSELSLILSKESKNKYIVNLRIITAALLIVCSVLCVVQYTITGQVRTSIQSELQKIKKVSEIKTQMLSINLYINYLTQFSSVEPLTFHNMHENIDELNQKLNSFMFSQNAQLVYSDGSSDDYYLGFAMNKLISEANSAEMAANGRITNSPSTYFVQYNTVNGMSLSLDKQAQVLWENLQAHKATLLTLCLIFLGVGLFLCLVIIMVKNILLRLVIHKKTEILEIFFQIPRAACSIIQKECEAFIIQLSVENQDEQIEFENTDEEIENQQNKNVKIQKKRTTVGEENTQFMYCVVSILFLFLLIFYQIFILAKCNIQKQDLDQLTQSTKLFYNIQHRLFQMATFIQSITVNNTLPIQNTFGRQAILAVINNSFADDILQVRINFYELQRILDEDFDQKTAKIYYQSVCGEGEICGSTSAEVAEENNGLNSVLSRYLEVLKQNFRLLTIEANPTPNQENFLRIKKYQFSMKEHWRQLTGVIEESEKKYMESNEVENLWVLVSVCIVYLLLLMVAWMKYYWRLEERIVATEYILAFIPIDEVNKNKKIANYIRNEISNRK